MIKLKLLQKLIISATSKALTPWKVAILQTKGLFIVRQVNAQLIVINSHFLSFHHLLQSAIESVLHRIVRPSWKLLGDKAPFVTMDDLESDDFLVLLFGPLTVKDFRVHLCLPSFPALLPVTARDMIGNPTPFTNTVDHDVQLQKLVLLCSPSGLRLDLLGL